MSVRELAYAKINLTLGVLGRRPDGYHELQSLVTFADVHDVVSLEPGTDGSVTVVGPFAHYIGGENLLIRALALLREADPGLRLGSVRLDKHLPVAAGIGGGSADGAALLRAARRASRARAAGIPWHQIAARLGADVPICLHAQPGLIRGKGDNVAPVLRLPQVAAVLVNPGQPLPTERVFAALQAAPAPSCGPSKPSIALSSLDDLLNYMRAHGNDLERPAIDLLPVIGDLKSALQAQPDCRIAAMSGSGPTCFGVFSSAFEARRAADRIANAHTDWWVKSTSLQGVGG